MSDFSENISFEDSSNKNDRSDKSSDSSNYYTKNKKIKKESWSDKLAKNRPIIIMTIVFIMFMCMLIYLYMKGKIFFS